MDNIISSYFDVNGAQFFGTVSRLMNSYIQDITVTIEKMFLAPQEKYRMLSVPQEDIYLKKKNGPRILDYQTSL